MKAKRKRLLKSQVNAILTLVLSGYTPQEVARKYSKIWKRHYATIYMRAKYLTQQHRPEQMTNTTPTVVPTENVTTLGGVSIDMTKVKSFTWSNDKSVTLYF